MTGEPVVVCADDDEDILALVALRLRRAGFRVRECRDGDSALEAVHDERPALAVLDVTMPRRDGYEVLRAIRNDEDLRGMKVVLLSARVQDADVERGLEAGADAYVPKPFKADELVEAVRELVGPAPYAAGAR